uniref:Uncharacterized protein n=1 Tax=Acrobeloides nanus TaxID=290746 RepID=A0A914EDI5_9BILA
MNVYNMIQVNGFIKVTAGLTCNKYRFSKPDPSVYSYGHNEDDSSSDDDSDDEDKNGEIIDKLENGINKTRNHIKNGNKSKISQSSNANSIIGKRINVSCTAKGIDDGSGYIKLCSACWAWRELPSNYFPRYVNEVICDDKDSECLSGYAMCRAGTRTFQVIKNGGRVASVVTLTSSSYCECKVLSGSPLTSLVTGSRGKLPPISRFVSNTHSTPSTTGNPPLFGKQRK